MTKKTIGAALIALYREDYGYTDTSDRAALIEKLQAVSRRVDWGVLLDAAETVGIPHWERPDYVPSKVTGAELAEAWEAALKDSRANIFDTYWLLHDAKERP